MREQQTSSEESLAQVEATSFVKFKIHEAHGKTKNTRKCAADETTLYIEYAHVKLEALKPIEKTDYRSLKEVPEAKQCAQSFDNSKQPQLLRRYSACFLQEGFFLFKTFSSRVVKLLVSSV